MRNCSRSTIQTGDLFASDPQWYLSGDEVRGEGLETGPVAGGAADRALSYSLSFSGTDQHGSADSSDCE